MGDKPFKDLAEMIRAVRGFSSGEMTREIVSALGQKALDISQENWRQGKDPTGQQWKGGKKLIKTGKMFSGLALKETKSTIVLRLEAPAKNGANYAVTHQVGKTIKAKKEIGGVLKFKYGDRWISKKSVKIPMRPMMPLPRVIPEKFASAFMKEAEKILSKDE